MLFYYRKTKGARLAACLLCFSVKTVRTLVYPQVSLDKDTQTRPEARLKGEEVSTESMNKVKE